MLAYNMLLSVIPLALLGLFVAGQVLSSHAVQHSVLNDLQEVFPGTAAAHPGSLLDEVRTSTTSTGVIGLVGQPVAGLVVLAHWTRRFSASTAPRARLAQAENASRCRCWSSC